MSHTRNGDDEEGWVVNNDICTDVGTVLGFFDTFQPQPWDNSQQLYYVDDPHIAQPLVCHDEPTVGFCALNGESVVSFPQIRRKNRSVCVSNGSASKIRPVEFCSSRITSHRIHTRAGARINSTTSPGRIARGDNNKYTHKSCLESPKHTYCCHITDSIA